MTARPINRRDVLKWGGLGAASLALGCAPRWVPPEDSAAGPMPVPAHDRFATAMWDGSWATRRWGDENEYADWDRVLDELAARGYNNVRIEVYPHLVAATTRTHPDQRFVLEPQRPLLMWGNHQAVEISPVQDLLAFMTKCRDRGISVGLSSWFAPDRDGHYARVCEPDDFARIWHTTLLLFDQAGVSGTVLWVDLCNEFPLDVWAHCAAQNIFGTEFATPAWVALRGVPWPARWAERTQQYLSQSLSLLTAQWPQHKFCFSFHDLAGTHLRALDVRHFGIAEVHCWLTDDPVWNLSSRQILPLLEIQGGVLSHARRMADTPATLHRQWLVDVLEPRMRTWSTWARTKGLPLVTTEGWGPTNYSDIAELDNEWHWVRSFAELAVGKAIDYGWTGICTSNFCQPHHRGMWSDPGWHREMTAQIRGS